ncbi:hypothetical protein QFZ94_000773 [Paraburkholderia sp. JPY465]|uniref:hypothetical protein n=1 Tax=Paraburkholderia sp. JPY465 TaxID=3042285 RepID=UPI003D226E16
MTNFDDQLRNSTVALAERPYDEHRAIADAWLQRAIDGVRQMHLNWDVRRELAGRLF